MKLRHRRGVIDGEGPILPLTINSNTNSTATRQRRRRRPIQHKIVMMRAACCLVTCLFSVIIIVFLVLDSFSRHRNHSQTHKLLPKLPGKGRKGHTPITCTDAKTSGFKNDDYCDCVDGSDEPNTSACSYVLVNKKSFRCKDGIMIHASRVNDGVFDCPDQTDER